MGEPRQAKTFTLVRALAASRREVAPTPEENQQLQRERHMHEFHAATATHLRRCGLEDREIEALTGGNLDKEAEAMKAVQAFMKAPESCLLLLAGVTEAGKTIAACSALLRAVVLVGEDRLPYWNNSARYVKAADLADRPAFDQETVRDTGRLGRLELLVIDELGTEKALGAWNSVLDEIIDARHRRKLKTILVTNVGTKPPEGRPGDECAFAERYGKRLWRRIDVVKSLRAPLERQRLLSHD